MKIGIFPENLVERLAPALEPDLALHVARKPGLTTPESAHRWKFGEIQREMCGK